jgi:hypothetical protein
VRAFYKGVPENKKREWLLARAIYRHFKASLKPIDPNAPKKSSPLELERATNIQLQEELHIAQEQLKRDGSLFDLAGSNAAEIVAAISGNIGLKGITLDKIEDIAKGLLAEVKRKREELKRKRQRPAG